MALCNCLTLMLVLEPPFDFGTCSLSKVWIAVLTPVLIFTYFSNIPWVSRQELLFRISCVGIYIFESALVEASTDLLLLHVTSHTDRHRDLGGRVPADFFFFFFNHTQKLYFRKLNLSAYTCMHYSQNLSSAAIVFNRRIKISITKNFPFGFSTKALCLLANFYNDSHLLISRHHKEIKTKNQVIE